MTGKELFDEIEKRNVVITTQKKMIDTNFKNATLSSLTILPSGKMATSGWATLKDAKFKTISR